VRGRFGGGGYANPERIVGSLTVVDPLTAEVKLRKDLPYPDLSGVLTTAGGIVVTAMLDGTILAYDDQTLDKLWRSTSATGFRGAAMTYAVNGKQYIAIASGIGPVGKAKDRALAGAQVPGQRDHVVRVRTVTLVAWMERRTPLRVRRAIRGGVASGEGGPALRAARATLNAGYGSTQNQNSRENRHEELWQRERAHSDCCGSSHWQFHYASFWALTV